MTAQNGIGTPAWGRMGFNGPEVFTGVQENKGDAPLPPLLGRENVFTESLFNPEGSNVSDAGDDHDAPYEEQAAARAQRRAERGLPMKKAGHRRGSHEVLVTGRMADLLNGDLSVDDLDDEELMSGMLRDKTGKLNSRNKLIPKSMHQELMRRILQRGQEKIRSDYFKALDVVGDIMDDSNNDPAIRLRAANMIIERIAGKTPEKVELSVEVKKYEEVAVNILRELPDDIEEAELVDEDE